jgi:hypothetical protein
MCVQYFAGQVFCFYRYLIRHLHLQAGFVVIDENGEVYPVFVPFVDKPIFVRMSANISPTYKLPKQPTTTCWEPQETKK